MPAEPHVFDLERERRDPESLTRLLFGGYSRGSKRRYPGLTQRIIKQISGLYALPSPQGYATDSRLKGEERWVPGGSDQRSEADAVELAVALRAFLRIPLSDPDKPELRISRDELLNLARRSNGLAKAMLNRERVHPKDAERVHDLAVTYLCWLGRNCEHKRQRSEQGGRVLVCPDCGTVEVGVGERES